MWGVYAQYLEGESNIGAKKRMRCIRKRMSMCDKAYVGEATIGRGLPGVR